jgi:hypothetical protein
MNACSHAGYMAGAGVIDTQNRVRRRPVLEDANEPVALDAKVLPLCPVRTPS